MHPVDGIPPLPDGIEPVNQTAQLIFTLGQVPPLLIVLYLAVRWSREMRSATPLMFLAGGLLMAVIEPIVDHNGLVWFPTDGQWATFTSMGVTMPIWLVMAYVWFFGGQTLVVWRMLVNGMDPRRLWVIAPTIVGVDILLEHPALYADLFLYYGNQPFEFTKFPLWWGFINGTSPIIIAAVCFKLLPLLPRRSAMLAPILLLPTLDAAANAGRGWPVWNLINTDAPAWVTWVVGGGGCLVLCVLSIHYTVKLLSVGTGPTPSAPDDPREAGHPAPPVAVA